MEKCITLILTQACNLKCTYCYEHQKSCKTMSFETAKMVLDNEFSKSDGYDLIQIDLFGGEPFLEFDLIKNITEYVEQNFNGYNYRLFASTNGTLVHGEVQKWLLEKRRIFSCGLSLDGNRNMHNINRSNSFDAIDLDFFAHNYPNQTVKMTISVETLPHLYDGVVFCHEKGFKVACNLAFGIDWSDPKNMTVLEEQLLLLIDYYIENPSIEPCTMLNGEIAQLGYEGIDEKCVKWCGAGTHMRTYDVDGKCYPCQFFTPMSTNSNHKYDDRTVVFEQNIPIEKLDKKCQLCKVRAACPFCYGSNYANTGNLYIQDDNICKLTRKILLARSYFKALQWKNGQLDLTEEKEQALLRSILLIQENLK